MKTTLLLAFAFLTSVGSYGQTYIGVTGGLNASKTNIDEQTETMITGASSYEVNRVINGYYGVILSNGLGTKGRLNLQTGFNVITKGYGVEIEYTAPGVKNEIERNYAIRNFEIPLMFRLVLGRPNRGIDPYLIGGGYLGIIRKAKGIYNEELTIIHPGPGMDPIVVTTEYDEQYKPYNGDDLAGSNMFHNGMFLSSQKDLGLVYGGGFAFNLGGGPKLFIEAKASRSFNNRSIYMDVNGNASDPKVGNRVFYLSTGLLIPIFSSSERRDEKWDD